MRFNAEHFVEPCFENYLKGDKIKIHCAYKWRMTNKKKDLFTIETEEIK